MLRVSSVSLSPDHDPQALLRAAAGKLGVSPRAVTGLEVLRQAVDARRGQVRLVYTLAVSLATGEEAAARLGADVQPLPADEQSEPQLGERPLSHRPVVVGAGPAGIFAGLWLARYGYRPILLERGEPVLARAQTVQRFWEGGPLSPESNVQFGEGGAGTFSDGKLNTRIRDRRCAAVLDAFVQAGAEENIRWNARAHIGTDKLREVVAGLRTRIESLGGEYRFSARVDGLVTNGSILSGLRLQDGSLCPANAAVLAIGHSARDSLRGFYNDGLFVEPKAFAMGVRVEHPQAWLNTAQYGPWAGHPTLGAADYQLSAQVGGRAVHTFCMCPGGVVVNASSQEERLCVNGMSYHARAGQNANSAWLASVTPSDIPGDDPLRGLGFQEHWESTAFRMGGGNWRAPVSRLCDFMDDVPSRPPEGVLPTVLPGAAPVQLGESLPGFVAGALRASLPEFDRKLQGFALGDALLTGIEARSSSPVRIPRGADGQSVSIAGVFPAGEGAGYAGGIVSAAVDGIRAAEALMALWGRG